MSNGETGENGSQIIAQEFADQRSVAQPLWSDENPLDSSLSQNAAVQSVERDIAVTPNGRHGRRQDSLTASHTLFIRTNQFNSSIPQYSNSFSIAIPYPTTFTPDLIKHALTGLNAIYRDGFRYKKAGIFLSKITSLDAVQPDLFGNFSVDEHTRKGRVMFIVDAINRIYGRDTLFFAVQGNSTPLGDAAIKAITSLYNAVERDIDDIARSALRTQIISCILLIRNS